MRAASQPDSGHSPPPPTPDPGRNDVPQSDLLPGPGLTSMLPTVRAQPTTFSPCWTRARATAAPMPPEAPVTSASRSRHRSMPALAMVPSRPPTSPGELGTWIAELRPRSQGHGRPSSHCRGNPSPAPVQATPGPASNLGGLRASIHPPLLGNPPHTAGGRPQLGRPAPYARRADMALPLLAPPRRELFHQLCGQAPRVPGSLWSRYPGELFPLKQGNRGSAEACFRPEDARTRACRSVPLPCC